MRRQVVPLLTLLISTYSGSCDTGPSNDMDAGTEPNAGLPNASLPQRTDFFQVERAAAYDEYVQNCFGAPHVMGHHGFECVDERVGGRGDGEDKNFGIVKVGEAPYGDFVDPVRLTNLQAPYLEQ